MEEKLKQQLQIASSMEDSFREEEFYEEIEAPKFVDFTLPDHFDPDDRYWFCYRVGCDQRHEEEMDSEAIYKNFVLRVMAARSPNVRLRKALTRRPTGENKKCPLTAPPKPTKSRLPRLAIASSISKKLVLDDKATNKPRPEKPCSTPKARVKHVAAKYMTTVKKKKVSSPNPNAFRSARNPKRTSIRLSRNKLVTKALAFSTPRKAQKAKASEDLATPITKLCEGLKKTEISKKPSKECRSARKALPMDASNKQTSGFRKNDSKSARNVKTKAKIDDMKKGKIVLGVAKTRDDSSDMELEGKSRAGSMESHSGMKLKAERKVGEDLSSPGSGSGSSSSHEATGSENTLTSKTSTETQDKVSAPEDPGPNGGDQSNKQEDDNANDDVENQNPGSLGELTNSHEKDNGLNSDNVRNVDAGNLSKQNAPLKEKVKTADKTLKENCSARNQGVKYRKLKPTNPKPFRLRTDERGILKEATLERKTNSNENATEGNENVQCAGNELSENKEKQIKKETDKSSKQDHLKPIKSRYVCTSKIAGSKPGRGIASCPEKSSNRNKHQREAGLQVNSGANRIEKSKAMILKPKEPRKATKVSGTPASKAPVAQKLATQGRRAVTIPKEPHFHDLHKPKGCTKNAV